MELSRRDLLRSLGILLAGTGLSAGRCARWSLSGAPARTRSIPLIHTTDLYHPPQDPDDHVDLATVFALEEYDLKGVVLDVTERFLREAPIGHDIARDPGFVPVAQMAHITGRAVRCAQGPAHALTHPGDTCDRASLEEQAGIRLILDILEESPGPVTVSVTGSPRALTAAYNRDPALLQEKIRSVLLVAGSTGGPRPEWNVQLDPNAYAGLWRSELPIDWYPPGTESGAFDPEHERSSYWKARHADLFRNLPDELRGYFAYALSANPGGDIIRVLTSHGERDGRQMLLSGERNLWSTAALVMGAGRVLVNAEAGWRFLPESAPEAGETWPWRLDPVRSEVNEAAQVTWEVVDQETSRRIFGRRPGAAFGAAMTQALNALFRDMSP